MSVGKNIEITASSQVSFEDAITNGIAKAAETIHDIRGAWIKDQKLSVADGEITEFRVTMIVTFVLG